MVRLPKSLIAAAATDIGLVLIGQHEPELSRFGARHFPFELTEQLIDNQYGSVRRLANFHCERRAAIELQLGLSRFCQKVTCADQP